MHKLQLRFKLLSSLVHTEETSSNIANIYREKVFHDGEVYTIPAVHGNSIRGLLRNIGANQFLKLVGVEEQSLKLNFFHILFSGGALDSMEIGLDISHKQNVRFHCPFLSLFGSAMGSEMLRGKMMITSLLPECKELGTGEHSFRDMTSVVRYTRQDDSKGELGDARLRADTEKQKQQMFYDIEVLNAGTVLNGEVYLDTDNEIEVGCFYAIMQEFLTKPFIGGASRVGHGKVELLIDGVEEKAKPYFEFLSDNQEALREWIESQK